MPTKITRSRKNLEGNTKSTTVSWKWLCEGCHRKEEVSVDQYKHQSAILPPGWVIVTEHIETPEGDDITNEKHVYCPNCFLLRE